MVSNLHVALTTLFLVIVVIVAAASLLGIALRGVAVSIAIGRWAELLLRLLRLLRTGRVGAALGLHRSGAGALGLHLNLALLILRSLLALPFNGLLTCSGGGLGGDVCAVVVATTGARVVGTLRRLHLALLIAQRLLALLLNGLLT